MAGALPLLPFHLDIALDSSLIVSKRYQKKLPVSQNLLFGLSEWSDRVGVVLVSPVIAALTRTGKISNVIELGAPFSPLREDFSESLSWELVCPTELHGNARLFIESETSNRRGFNLRDSFIGSNASDLVFLNLNHATRYGVNYCYQQLLQEADPSSPVLIVARVSTGQNNSFVTVNCDKLFLTSEKAFLASLQSDYKYYKWQSKTVLGFDEGFLMEEPLSSLGSVLEKQGGVVARTGLLIAVRSETDLSGLGFQNCDYSGR